MNEPLHSPHPSGATASEWVAHLAGRREGASLDEIVLASGLCEKTVSSSLHRGTSSGTLHKAKAVGEPMRYFVRATHAMAWLELRSAHVPGALMVAVEVEVAAEAEALRRAVAADILIAQPRRINRMAGLAPADARVDGRPGALQARQCPSRRGNRLHYPDGRVTDLSGAPIKAEVR